MENANMYFSTLQSLNLQQLKHELCGVVYLLISDAYFWIIM